MKKPDRLFQSPGPGTPAGPGELSFNRYHLQGTPIGDLVVVYQGTPFFVHRIFLPNRLTQKRGEAFPENAACHRVCPEITQIAESILNYLQGDPASLAQIPWQQLYLKDLSPLQVKVLRKTGNIPYGKTASYRDIAEAIGRPRACRFVGTALAKNPFPILIPCHRVVRSDGSPGKFGGGENLKKWLIDMESRNKA